MTDQELLDEFAKAAMVAIISKMEAFGANGKFGAKPLSEADAKDLIDKVAGGAYRYAKAMMVERVRQGSYPLSNPIL